MTKRIFVIDTNVLLSYPEAFTELSKDNDIIIPFKVIEEIDNNKSRIGSVGANARRSMRLLDELRKRGSLFKGVSFEGNKGKITVELFNAYNLPRGVDESDPDNQVISSAMEIKKRFSTKKVTLLTNDVNMRVKCDSFEILSEEYAPERSNKNVDELYDGFSIVRVDDKTVDSFYAGTEVFLPEGHKAYPNQFIMLQSRSDDKKTALTRLISEDLPLRSLLVSKNDDFWGIRPRNKEQLFALELILDKNVDLVTLSGRSGVGKTLVALAGALRAVFDKNMYKRISILRPIVTVGKDLGYLPGSLTEKMAPYTAPIIDNLNFLFEDERTLEEYLEKGVITIEAIPYIRGRSIANSILIVDEAQNLTQDEAKTILTRCGESSKIIFSGDYEQLDSVHLSEVTNGLTQVAEQFKAYDLSGHVTMKKGERSRLATLAARIMR